jgi:hypothetical protein
MHRLRNGRQTGTVPEKTAASYCSDEGQFVYSTYHYQQYPSSLHSSKRASMQHSEDMLDIALLRSDRNGFILKCQPIIEIITKNFIRTGLFEPQQLRDVIQTVNEQLIIRLPGIERNYNGKVLMTTYMNAVIRNICLSVHKKEHQSVQTVPLNDSEQGSDGETAFRSLMMQDELQRFSVILTLFHQQRPKLLLCLKLFHRLPLTVHDIMDCFEKITEKELTILMSLYGGNFDDVLESDIFNSISPFMNRKENNQTTGASLRRWTQEQSAKVISLMNSGPDRRAHTKETIKVLLEHFNQRQRL